VVFACARQPSSSAALKDCKHRYGARLHLITLDVTDESSVQVIRLTFTLSLRFGELLRGNPPVWGATPWELCPMLPPRDLSMPV
jgi:hypothetical protein